MTNGVGQLRIEARQARENLSVTAAGGRIISPP
jgi:hypothetical protein